MIRASSLTKEFYRPGEVAKLIGVTTRTIQAYNKQGRIISSGSPTGRRLFKRDEVIRFLDSIGMIYKEDERFDAIYARVSTNEGDLERQISKLTSYAATRNPKNLKVYSEVASGLNDKRKQLCSLIKDIEADKVDRIFIASKDRLTRFGYNYLELICSLHGTEIVIVSGDTSEEELAEDIISIIRSLPTESLALIRESISG